MYIANDPMPNCGPEYCREQQEERDRRYDLAMQRRALYLSNKRKLDAAARSGLPVLSFGGYDSCWKCPNADHDTMTDDEDDICRVICHDPSCPEHAGHRAEGNQDELAQQANPGACRATARKPGCCHKYLK